jgi:hypothetical protein
MFLDISPRQLLLRSLTAIRCHINTAAVFIMCAPPFAYGYLNPMRYTQCSSVYTSRPIPNHSKLKAEPSSNSLTPPCPTLLFRLHILFRIHIRLKIHCTRLPQLRALQQLPAHYHEQENGQLNVKAHEVDRTELRTERAPSLY